MGSERSSSPPLSLHAERERKISTKTKKQPPMKKRHTKPCKFYQTGRCPYSAEECNFAHVLVVPTPVLPLPPGVGMGGLCKYYPVGQCPAGSVCGCGHDRDIGAGALGVHLSNLQLSPGSPVSPSTLYSGDFNYPRPPNAYPPGYYHPAWPSNPYGEHPGTSPINTGHNPGGPNTGSYGPESPSVSISTSTESSATSQLETPGPDGGLSLAGLGLSGAEKEGTRELQCEEDANVNQVHNCDEDVIVTENPQFSEHAHNPHQSQVRVMDVEHAPFGMGFGFGGHSHGHAGVMGGGYPFSPPPPWEAGGGVHYFTSSPTLGFGDQKVLRTSPPTRSSSRASSRSKTAKYKTKPCKFFNTEGGCPGGGSCTFIHDASIPPVPLIVRGRSKSPRPHGSPETDTKPSIVAKNQKHGGKSEKGAPQVDNVEAEDNKEKKNFFPITWRVIGGGVLIGGKRAAGSVDNFHTGQGGSSLEGTGEEGEKMNDAPSKKKGLLKFGKGVSRLRSRSTSTPPTRPVVGSGRGGNDTLFSAESP